MTELRVDLPVGEMCPVKAYLMRVHGISGSLWKRIKHHGAFALNGSPAIAARTMVKDGDRITYDLPIVSTVVPEVLPLSIVYEDDDLLVLDKPAGQLVHPTTKETRGTIANAVRGYYAACGVHLDVHPCHRLDRNTSGLLLIAKHPEVQYQIMRQNALRREYLALIEGTILPPAGCIDAPIARALPKMASPHAPIMKRSIRTANTASCACGLTRGARTRSASISPIADIRCSATISMAERRSQSHGTPSTLRISPSCIRAPKKRSP